MINAIQQTGDGAPPRVVYRQKGNDGVEREQTAECSVMMVNDVAKAEAIYIGTDEDPPGLAIVDTACSRTMHGRPWRERYEAALAERGLRASIRPRHGYFSS